MPALAQIEMLALRAYKRGGPSHAQTKEVAREAWFHKRFRKPAAARSCRQPGASSRLVSTASVYWLSLAVAGRRGARRCANSDMGGRLRTSPLRREYLGGSLHRGPT